MAEFYYPELMGVYEKTSTLNRRPVYGQFDGNKYLYWSSMGVWNVRICLILLGFKTFGDYYKTEKVPCKYISF